MKVKTKDIKQRKKLVFAELAKQFTALKKKQGEIELENKELRDKLVTRPSLGLSKKDIKDFSIAKCIGAVLRKSWNGAELEREIIEAENKLHGMEYSTKTLTLGNDVAAGFLIPNEVKREVIDVLRPAYALDKLPVMRMPGLSMGNLEIVRQTASASGQWVGELAGPTASDQAFDMLTLTPKKSSAKTYISNDLLRRNALTSVEALVRRDISEVLVRLHDRAFFEGTGVSGQPKGMTLLKGLTTTFVSGENAAVRIGKLQDMIEQVELNNADLTGAMWVMPISVWQDIRQIKVAVSSAADSASVSPTIPFQAFAFNDGDVTKDVPKMFLGYPVVTTNNLTAAAGAADLFFGDWRDVIHADWGAPFVKVTSEGDTLSSTDQTLVIAFQSIDNHIRHPVSISHGVAYDAVN